MPSEQKNVLRQTPWGEMTYLDYKHKIEFGKKEFDEIDDYCRQKGIDWSASPWDMDSLKFLLNYNIPWIKIASATITNEELVQKLQKIIKKLFFLLG